jgi:protein Mpv17
MFRAGLWSLLPGGQGIQSLSRSLRHAKKSRGNGKRDVSSSSAANAASSSSPSSPSPSMNLVLKSALISGSLSLAGDLVAQLLTGASSKSYDAARAARMGSFGLVFYGPYQHYWYAALDKAFNAKTTRNFAIKVFLNQAVLAPVVISAVFAWTLGLQNKLDEFPAKCERDFWKTMTTGWKFWVPAASINFYAVPLSSQVMYMSCCGVIWTAYLSYSSSKAQLDGPKDCPKKKGKPCCCE